MIKSSFIGEMVSPSWRKKDQELHVNKIITQKEPNRKY
jgi:hypothetical protein